MRTKTKASDTAASAMHFFVRLRKVLTVFPIGGRRVAENALLTFPLHLLSVELIGLGY